MVKPGRTLTVCDGRAYAVQDGVETLVATMTGTLMALQRRSSRQNRPCSSPLEASLRGHSARRDASILSFAAAIILAAVYMLQRNINVS